MYFNFDKPLVDLIGDYVYDMLQIKEIVDNGYLENINENYQE